MAVLSRFRLYPCRLPLSDSQKNRSDDSLSGISLLVPSRLPARVTHVNLVAFRSHPSLDNCMKKRTKPNIRRDDKRGAARCAESRMRSSSRLDQPKGYRRSCGRRRWPTADIRPPRSDPVWMSSGSLTTPAEFAPPGRRHANDCSAPRSTVKADSDKQPPAGSWRWPELVVRL